MAKNLLNTTAALNTNAAAAAAPKKVRAPRKPRAAKAETITMEHAVTIPVAGDEDLGALLADLGVDMPADVSAGPDEVIEQPVLDAAADVVLLEPTTAGDEDLEAAVRGAETAELMSEAATDDGGFTVSEPAAAVADGEAAAPEKKAATPRVRYTDKVERLKARVGDKLAEYSVLTTADVPADDAALGEVMDRTMDIIKAMNKKVGNRGVNFIEWLSGKKAALNNVLDRTLRLLDADGHLQTGEEGNLMKNLLARPYSAASARAMGGNTIVMFKELKVILPVEGTKGRFVANPDSLLLAAARAKLAAPAAAAADDTSDASDAGEEGADTE